MNPLPKHSNDRDEPFPVFTGCFWGLVFSLPFWILIGVLIWG